METTTQIYMEVTPHGGPKVLGESQAGGYENRIDIDRFSFNCKAKKKSLAEVMTGTVRNNLDFDKLSVSKVFDRASLTLASLLNQRKRLTEIRISVDQQFIDPSWGEDKIRNEILIIEFHGAYITEIKLRTSEAGAGAQIKEDITFSFHRFRVTYYAEDRDAKRGLIQSDYRTEVHMYESPEREQSVPE